MLSRIADSLFWMNRYMERCDGLVRGVKIHYILMLDKGINENISWRPLLEIFAPLASADMDVLANNTDASIYRLLLDTSNANSLKVMIHRARENARGVQDHITKEVWEHINQMYHLVNALDSEQLKGFEAIETVENLEQNCLMYNGVADATMPRGLGWCFMNLGRYIERCMLTLEMTEKYYSLIDYDLNNELDILDWRPLLLALSGYELHLKTYRAANHTQSVLHQVLVNENFTRSVIYTLKRLVKYYKNAIKNNSIDETEQLTKILGRLLSNIEYEDLNSLNSVTLQAYLSDIKNGLNNFSNRLAQYFFSYA